MITIVKKLFRFLASYGMSCTLFILLLALTYFGTIHQVENGLYESQKKYFESIFLIHWVFGWAPLPLPGGYLVLGLLFVNLVCGAVIRARKGWSHLGILIAHAGICLLMIGAFVTFEFSTSGHLTLYEKDRSNEFESPDEWEIGVAEINTAGPATEYLVREPDFCRAGARRSQTFTFENVPFDMTISGYCRNATTRSVDREGSPEGKVVDGYYLESLPPEREAEQNAPGAYVVLTEKSSAVAHDGILSGLAGRPYVVGVDGKQWQVNLRRRRWPLPFTVVLNKFTHELHPGTSMPKVFRSDVTVIQTKATGVAAESVQQDVQISMNEPLRLDGYTLYQSSWGPPDARPGDPLFSTFAVVKNPVEQYPLYACVTVTFGLALHFAQKLLRYLRKESMNRP